jgi:3-phenylpropionate/trans-cinnamate dioxygenase ferredoxin reductase subunit
MEQPGDRRAIHLQVRRVRGGRVSSALGATIKAGHRVKLKGPFGSAFLRPGQNEQRLVLVASGTGFAPIWSIADAAMRENSRRELVLAVGARSIEMLYMIPALLRLARCPNAMIIPVVDKPQTVTAAVHTGSPVDYLPTLYADDIVYAAGSPRLVEAVKDTAKASGASCYSDPFVPNAEGQRGLLSRAASWLLGAPPLASTPIVPAQAGNAG